MTIRHQRLTLARAIRTHTPAEWSAVLVEFNRRCVRCGIRGVRLQKDHVVPLYQGGDDGITNLQPLCSFCNLNKVSETTDWKEERRRNGWRNLVPRVLANGSTPHRHHTPYLKLVRERKATLSLIDYWNRKLRKAFDEVNRIASRESTERRELRAITARLKKFAAPKRWPKKKGKK